MLPDENGGSVDRADEPQTPAETHAANAALRRAQRADHSAEPPVPDIPKAQEGVGHMDPRKDEQEPR